MARRRGDMLTASCSVSHPSKVRRRPLDGRQSPAFQRRCQCGV